MASNSMSLCQVCDKWFYEYQGHTHDRTNLEEFIKSRINKNDGYYLHLSCDHREITTSHHPRVDPGRFLVKYRSSYLGNRNKKVYFSSFDDCIRACVNFLDTGVFDESRSS